MKIFHRPYLLNNRRFLFGFINKANYDSVISFFSNESFLTKLISKFYNIKKRLFNFFSHKFNHSTLFRLKFHISRSIIEN